MLPRRCRNTLWPLDKTLCWKCNEATQNVCNETIFSRPFTTISSKLRMKRRNPLSLKYGFMWSYMATTTSTTSTSELVALRFVCKIQLYVYCLWLLRLCTSPATDIILSPYAEVCFLSLGYYVLWKFAWLHFAMNFVCFSASCCPPIRAESPAENGSSYFRRIQHTEWL